MKIRNVIVLIIGLILLIYSAFPLWLMAQEKVYQSQVRNDVDAKRIYVNTTELGKVEILGYGAPLPVSNIAVRNYMSEGNNFQFMKTLADYESLAKKSHLDSLKYAREYFWEGNTIRLEDQFRAADWKVHDFQQAKGKLNIKINDKDWSIEKPIEIRPYFVDENRYHGYFGLLDVKVDGREQLVLVQRISGTDFKKETDLAWRTLTIEKSGQVAEDQFTFQNRADIPQRVNYINLTNASPISLGYKSNILQVWPSLFFPILYPFVTGSMGLILTTIGALFILFGIKKSRSV